MEADVRVEAVSDRAPIQDIALLVGVGFLVAGIGGFIPGVTSNVDHITFAGHGSDAQLFGVFQVSILHNLVHLLFGVAGVVLSRTRESARAFLLGAGTIYLALFLYGQFTGQHSGANFVPLDHNDDVLHLSLGLGMLAVGLLPQRVSPGATESLAGFLAATAIFVSAIGLAYRPLRLIPLALVLALVAVAIGGRNERLSTAATFIAAACFVVGMAIAVVTSNPLW